MRRNKRILILVENLPVPFDRRVWMEATTLAEAGYQVSVICPRGQYSRSHEVLNGINIYRYPLESRDGLVGHIIEYGIALPMTFFLTWTVFFREGFDVIQSANPPDIFFLIGGVFKLFGKKFVFDHHDVVPETCEGRWSGRKLWLARTISLWLEKATFRTADRVISTNESYRKVALTRGEVPPQRAYVVRSGPSLNRFRAVPPQPELKNGKRYLVGYLGVMGPNDGIDLLLYSIEHLVHKLQRTDVQFILIGGGDLQPEMVHLSESLGLAEYVRFTGRIPDEEVIAILSTADIGVAPDPKDPSNDLSTMNKIVEYMALGKPLVAFDLQEARVSAGDAALYAQANEPHAFAEKIIELLELPDRDRMGAWGRERFESVLAWDHQRKNLLALYEELLG
jgi:glycosyltransferase involved in cell wall biosynthesis